MRLIALLDRKGQISSAAAQLGMTQSAASRLLSELEHTVGAKLYERHGRGVVLSEAGQAMARQALIILNQLDHAHQEISQIVDGARGQVRIGAVTGPAMQLVLPVIRNLRKTFPKSSFRFWSIPATSWPRRCSPTISTSISVAFPKKWMRKR
nr:LysR family transcriptional regulator [Marinicella sp. W31]MDC2879695.1 LysR family transcriptional regulator [Marinicella sp. W31]